MHDLSYAVFSEGLVRTAAAYNAVQKPHEYRGLLSVCLPAWRLRVGLTHTRSAVQVYSNGKGTDVNIDMHRGGEALHQVAISAASLGIHTSSFHTHRLHIACTAGPHNNLASNLDMGLGQRAFGSGGDGHRGDHAGEEKIMWNCGGVKPACPAPESGCAVSCISFGAAASLTLHVLLRPALPCSCQQHVLESGGQRRRRPIAACL